MRRLKFFIAAALAAGCFFLGGNIHIADASADLYYIGGMTAGFSLSAGGVEVVGFKDVTSESGSSCPATEAGMRTGDIIMAVDGIHTRSVEELNAAFARSAGKPVTLTLKRDGEQAQIEVTPVRDKHADRYKIGILIRDTLSGIGTVTYIEKETMRFGALGHAVCGEDKTALTIADSSVYLCSIVSVNRGERGKAGELRGLFLNDSRIGAADKVCATGLYGKFSGGYDLSDCAAVQSAPLSEAAIGKATIYSTVDGVTPKAYEIAIAKVDANNRDNKNFVIKVTDERLIAETGGIVQGMSGSPILQNGKLIGAVTHVFLNDPTRGYGIGIEKMLEK